MKTLSFTILILFASVALFGQTKKPVAKPAPKASASTAASLKAQIAAGKAVYSTYCIACHMADGGGVPNMNAPLIKTPFVLGPKARLINILLNGMQGVEIDGETYSNVMPPATYLTNKQIADVLTYVRNDFGNKASAVTVAEVTAIRNKK